MQVATGKKTTERLARPSSRVAYANTGIAKQLRKELSDSRGLPPAWRQAMQALASEHAEEVWARHGDSPENKDRLVQLVAAAIEDSVSELNRPAESVERSDINTVIKRAKDLKRAIDIALRQGSLPKTESYDILGPLHLEGLPDVQVALCWKPLAHDLAMYRPIAVADVLDGSIAIAQAHLRSLPPRATRRRRGTVDEAAATMFIRNLHRRRSTSRFTLTLGDIAHIATALCANPNITFDKNDVGNAIKQSKRSSA